MLKILFLIIKFFNFLNNYTIYEGENNYYLLNKKIENLESNKYIKIENKIKDSNIIKKLLNDKINYNKIISLNNIIKRSSEIFFISKDLMFFISKNKLNYFEYTNNKNISSENLLNLKENILNFELIYNNYLFILIELNIFIEIYKYDINNNIILKQSIFKKIFKNYEFIIIFDNLYLLYENNNKLVELSKIENNFLLIKITSKFDFEYLKWYLGYI